jgi:hypothetical protein
MTSKRSIAHLGAIAGIIAVVGATLPVSAAAQTATDVNDQIRKLQNEIRTIQKQYQAQIRGLQKQLDDLKAAQTAPKPAPVPPTASAALPAGAAKPLEIPPTAGVLPPPAVAEAKRGGFLGSGIDLTVGGYIEAASIYRTRNETADISSNFNTAIPFPNSPNYYLTEFRFSAHQTRLTLLGQGKVDPDTALAGYVETDFQSAPADSNSIESNSYTPRLRQAYATLDRIDLGFHLLGGQVYTLLTLFNHDMTPHQEDIPLTIDGQYVVGFTWTRNPQFRVVQELGKSVFVGFSLESPQTLLFSGPNPPLVPTMVSNPGGNHLNPLAQYSTDIAPALVAKMVYEPGWGHYELYGIGRLFRSRAAFANRTIWGGGGGAGAILPIIPKELDFQADFLYGDGIGRYGTSQFPDVAIKPTGVLAPIPELQALTGLIGHPTDALDLYAYAGIERAGQTSFTVDGTLPFGYGNPLYNNSGCLHEGSTLCAANTSRVWQVAGGGWYSLYKGSYGMLRIGAQGSYTRRYIFKGIGGSPSTDEGMFFTSLRYYPPPERRIVAEHAACRRRPSRAGHFRAAFRWHREVDDRPERHDARRIDGWIALVIVVLDMVEVHRLGDAGQAVDVAGEAPERRVIDDASQVALEVAVIGGVEPH